MEAQSNWTGRKAWEQFSTGCFLSASHTRRGKVYPVAHTKNCISLHIRFDPIYPHTIGKTVPVSSPVQCNWPKVAVFGNVFEYNGRYAYPGS